MADLPGGDKSGHQPPSTVTGLPTALNIAMTKLGSDHERVIEAELALAAALAARQ